MKIFIYTLEKRPNGVSLLKIYKVNNNIPHYICEITCKSEDKYICDSMVLKQLVEYDLVDTSCMNLYNGDYLETPEFNKKGVKIIRV